jgi:transposase-like protein
MFSSYQEMYLNTDKKKFIVEKRLEMVRYAIDNGYKAASRFYQCSKNTIKKWCRRYQINGMSGLEDQSRKPHHSPKIIKQADIDTITSITVEAKEKGKHITVNNVRRKSEIKDYSDETINRYMNKACGKVKNKKHPKSTGGSVEWKQHLKPFQHIQVDIKYLTDIDNLKPYFACSKNNYQGIKVKYEITARDVASGQAIVAYCDDKSAYYTKKFLEEILHPFLKQFEYLELKNITIQTDCGTEFTNKYKKTRGKSPIIHSFTVFTEEKFKRHKTNIPGHCTADSDVETFHWSIERDCLGWDDIVDNQTLIQYTSEYIERYNNSVIVTRGYSPMEKIKETFDVTGITFPKPQILTV